MHHRPYIHGGSVATVPRTFGKYLQQPADGSRKRFQRENELGIEHPDIDLLVKKLHENKGEYVGNYVRLNAQATREIYELANQ